MEEDFTFETLSRKAGTKRRFGKDSSEESIQVKTSEVIDEKKLEEYCASHDYSDTFRNNPIPIGSCSNYRNGDGCLNDEPCIYAVRYASE